MIPLPLDVRFVRLGGGGHFFALEIKVGSFLEVGNIVEADNPLLSGRLHFTRRVENSQFSFLRRRRSRNRAQNREAIQISSVRRCIRRGRR